MGRALEARWGPLRAALGDVEIEHVGSTSIPGALTKGDLDLLVRGSADDLLFGPFRDAMIADPALLAAYDRLKLEHDGEDYDSYTDAKGAFVEPVLRTIAARQRSES